MVNNIEFVELMHDKISVTGKVLLEQRVLNLI